MVCVVIVCVWVRFPHVLLFVCGWLVVVFVCCFVRWFPPKVDRCCRLPVFGSSPCSVLC